MHRLSAVRQRGPANGRRVGGVGEHGGLRGHRSANSGHRPAGGADPADQLKPLVLPLFTYYNRMHINI